MKAELLKHHLAMGELHAKISKAHTALGQSDLAQHHADCADCHIQMCKALAGSKEIDTHDNGTGGAADLKAAGNPWDVARAFDKMVPTEIRNVIPPGLTAVPRTGAPAINSEDDATAAVDRFAK